LPGLCNEIKSCSTCKLHLTRTNALCGEGKLKAHFFFIAQAPGEQEDLADKMFIGPSGKMFFELLKPTGLKPDHIYMTNLVKCHLPKNRRPKQLEIQKCSRFLIREIKEISPNIIVPLGYYASKFIFEYFGFKTIPRKDFKINFGKLFWRIYRIFPLQHPAAALHKPDLLPILKKNYLKLSILKEPCKWYDSCPLRYFEVKGLIAENWQQIYCLGDWESCVRYQDTLSGRYHPDNMMPDGRIDPEL